MMGRAAARQAALIRARRRRRVAAAKLGRRMTYLRMRSWMTPLRAAGARAARRRREEEQAWRDECQEFRLPGYCTKDGRIFSNETARQSWAEEFDHGPLLALLESGKADLRSQRLAAALIRQAADKPLPKRHENRDGRDRDIALWVMQLERQGVATGEAYALVARARGVSVGVETIRKVARRPRCMLYAKEVLAMRAAGIPLWTGRRVR
jgi:hypothetical protein